MFVCHGCSRHPVTVLATGPIAAASLGPRVHRRGARGDRDLGYALLSVAGIVLYIVITWYRQDDALAAGVLLALIIGSLAATVVVRIVINRSPTAHWGIRGCLAV